MKIKILPRMATPFSAEDIKCKVKVKCDPSWRGRNRELKKECSYFAKVIINDVPMCIKHAQEAALQILLKQQT
jgi:hypothetical protein